MKVVMIGSGNVAFHLGNALHAKGLKIAQVWSYHYKNAVSLANQVKAVAIQDLHSVDWNADLCIISVKDDAIAEIADQLKHFKGIVVHTSGAVALDVFAGKVENYGVFYPLQTFSKEKAIEFKAIPICIEANHPAILNKLQELGLLLSEKVEEVTSAKRKILHLTAVFACNFTNHLYALAEEMLAAQQLDFDLLRPLINETAAKVQTVSPLLVQTGPAIRNDVETLKRHEDLLKSDPKLVEIYKTLSESIKKTR